MKIKRRHEAIVEIIRKNRRASVEDLAGQLAISRETIRRDLTELAKCGKVQKVHGGATLPPTFGEGPFQKRLSDNAGAKLRIARVAAGLFSPGETLFIDTGSTTLYFAEQLAEVSGLTVITNSSEIARTVSSSKSGNRTFLLGGEFSPDNRQTVGTMAVSQIRSFRAHHAVLTIGALDEQTGAMDYNIEEAQIARAMIGQSQSLTVLVDSSKFTALASFEVCPLARINRIVCDKPPPASLARALKAVQTDVIVAP
ncbi:MAG TPA: DeoR/GlpR transcriptional regulator [Rhizobiales bacterium]|nr:DeoR/GlpR transcriptional regulator [Hyphomicrobiales bacterium]